MMKWATVGIVFFMFFGTLVPKLSAETPTEDVIVLFKDEIEESVLNDTNVDVEQAYKNVDAIKGEVPLAAIDELKKDKRVLAVEIDQQVKIMGQIHDWGFEQIHATKSWESNVTGKGIKVAVVDTGIAPHKDLEIAGGVSFVDYTNSYVDDNGHGTHVAGVIAAKNNNVGIVGVAPDASLYAVKVLDKEGNGYISDIIAGIDWSIQNNMDIVNFSIGAKENSPSLKKIVDKAYSKGTLIVASAGNSGTKDGLDDTVEYPARYESVIAVSAVDPNQIRGSFSAIGSTVEVASPGVNILSTYLTNQYVKMSGTSMAAPFVTGVLALLKQANPSLSNVQLRAKLQETAIDIGNTGKDSSYGYGFVQAPIVEEMKVPVAKEVDQVATEDTKSYKEIKTGWVKLDGNWFYYDTNGELKTGWLYASGRWYFLDDKGIMKTGWLQTGGTWYYLDGSGAMKTGWLQTGGKWYYLDRSGAMKTGWLQTGGTWYYLDGSGSMKIGWLQTGGKWYYLDGNGAMRTGWVPIEGTWNYFLSTGVWVK